MRLIYVCNYVCSHLGIRGQIGRVTKIEWCQIAKTLKNGSFVVLHALKICKGQYYFVEISKISKKYSNSKVQKHIPMHVMLK